MHQQLVFCYYNMKLKIRDIEAENDKVKKKDYLDLLNIAAEVGEKEEDNQFFQWVRPFHLDDEYWNLDPQIVVHVWEAGVDVNEYYLKKFILIVLAKTQEIHFYKELLNRQTFLSPLLTP